MVAVFCEFLVIRDLTDGVLVVGVLTDLVLVVGVLTDLVSYDIIIITYCVGFFSQSYVDILGKGVAL